GEMIAKKGKDTVAIPIPQVDIPHFKHGDKQQGGVGQGEGEVGDALGQGQEQPGQGHQAGDRPGDHLLDIEVSLQELAEIMGEEQKEIVRIESFWSDTWLQSQYHGVISRYIIHDAMAKEVDRDTFFRTRESGGTMISSAYKLCAKMIEDEYPSTLWNIYPFHF